MLEHQLLEAPCALAVFYSDTSTPRVPSVAVASGESCALRSRLAPSHARAAGQHVFIYRNLRPYYKFTLPSAPLEKEEVDVWERLKVGAGPRGRGSALTGTRALASQTGKDPSLTAAAAFKALAEMRDRGLRLSARSRELLHIAEEAAQAVSCAASRSDPRPRCF